MCIYSPMPHTLSYCALIGKCALIRSNTVFKKTNCFIYFSGGELAGLCRAGYWCVSGAESDIPVNTTDFNACQPNEQCAGMCPAGHYCENGTLIPTACPALTYRNETKGAQLSDCATCPAGYICDNGITLCMK